MGNNCLKFKFYIVHWRVAAPFQKNTLYIMSDRERLKAYLEQGYQKPPYFTMVDGIPSFEYPVHDNPHQFKTYAVWMKLLPIDDEKRDAVKVECLVPTCNSHISCLNLGLNLLKTRMLSQREQNCGV